MSDLLAARSQMAVSLAFHILFAVVGMAMPVLMAIAEWRFLRTKDPCWDALARRWAKGTAILFAVGAVSGTVLSFELGLLWPGFMEKVGPVVGLPFSLEAYAFFLEAIFLGVVLYGRGRVRPWVHLASVVVVAVSGLLSGVFVVGVNALMNTPTGFRLEGGELVDVDPWAAFKADSFPTQAAHMAFAAYASVAMVVLGIHAWRLLQRPDSAFHLAAARVAFAVALVAVPLQIVSGDRSAKHVAVHQPLKLAAAENLEKTTTRAPLSFLGVQVPGALSFLAFSDVDAEVKGLDAAPPDERPNVAVVRPAFLVMVGCGFAMLGVVAWGALLVVRRRSFATSRWFLRACVACAPLGLIAVEAGWFVTEVGRQPWIVRGVMKTKDAVVQMPGLVVPFLAFTGLYVLLGLVVVASLKRHVFAAEAEP